MTRQNPVGICSHLQPTTERLLASRVHVEPPPAKRETIRTAVTGKYFCAVTSCVGASHIITHHADPTLRSKFHCKILAGFNCSQKASIYASTSIGINIQSFILHYVQYVCIYIYIYIFSSCVLKRNIFQFV